MKFLMKLFKKQVFMRYVSKSSPNVIRFPDQNTLNTKVKQIENPQKKISGGFSILSICLKFFYQRQL
jgi:hypothetical protein